VTRTALASFVAFAALGCAADPVSSPRVRDDVGDEEPEKEPAPAAPAPPKEPTFASVIREVGPGTPYPLSRTWRSDCPIKPADLRLLEVSHRDFDGKVAVGQIVVQRSAAEKMVSLFKSLFDEKFPIERMRLVDEYEGSDDLSMAANNTSAFNCRLVPGTNKWSEHSYGLAIDINPVQNPYVKGSVIDPPIAREYLDRSLTTKGMIHDDDVTVRAFAAIGWKWGGDWTSLKDYQHFSANGR
jgi:hypothetical protein